MPLESDDEKLAYCTYTQVVSHKPNTEKMSNLSYDTSSDVLSACLKLKSSDDFNTAVKDLVQRLREICDSQYCCIMLMNIQDRTCHLLGESFSEDEEFNENDDWMDGHFFDVAETWEDLIGGSNCLIIKNKADWDYLQERNKPWCDELIYTGVKTMVLFPLRKNGNLLVRIPADQRRFREITMGKIIVMGRKTFESLPGQTGLYGRKNIVISYNPDYRAKNAEVVSSFKEAIAYLNECLNEGYTGDDIYIIGGESIYKLFLPLCDTVYMTKIMYEYEADTFFPELKEEDGWKMISESDEETYFDIEYFYREYQREL